MPQEGLPSPPFIPFLQYTQPLILLSMLFRKKKNKKLRKIILGHCEPDQRADLN